MEKETPKSRQKSSPAPRSRIPWHARAKYRVEKNTKKRRMQYQQQTSMLMMTLLVTVVVGGLIILFNWRNAGATKTVSCAQFPQFCVPLAGGSADEEALEAASSRTLDEDSHGADGVIRYVDDNVVTIGNPGAPASIAIASAAVFVVSLWIARRYDLFAMKLAPETCQKFFKWDEPKIHLDVQPKT